MRKKILIAAGAAMLVAAVLAGCGTTERHGASETIVFNCSGRSTFSAIGDVFSGGRFLVPGSGEAGVITYMPEAVKSEYDSGKDVFLLLDVNSIL